jgi:hypothetical protein
MGRPVGIGNVEGPPCDWREFPNGSPFTIDEVAEQNGQLPSVVLSRLLELELSGQIQRIGGGRFVRCGERVLP